MLKSYQGVYYIKVSQRVSWSRMCQHEPEDPSRQEEGLVHCRQSQDHQKDRQDQEVREVQEASSEGGEGQGDRGYRHLSCSENGPTTGEHESSRWGSPAFGLWPFRPHGDEQIGRSRIPFRGGS